MVLSRRATRWWLMWLLVCVPAGAAAGWGLVEFYPRYPSGGYDGGFMGDLLLFGGMMALVQAPFIGVFVRSVTSARDPAIAVVAVFGWIIAGFVGWFLGVLMELWIGIPFYSVPTFTEAAGRSLRWLVIGSLQGTVLAAALIASTYGDSQAVGRRRYLLALIPAWAITGAAGGFLFETWVQFDSELAGTNTFGIGRAISGVADDLGVAPNIADVVVPFALMLPPLYGILTGAVIFYAARGMQRIRTSP